MKTNKPNKKTQRKTGLNIQLCRTSTMNAA